MDKLLNIICKIDIGTYEDNDIVALLNMGSDYFTKEMAKYNIDLFDETYSLLLTLYRHKLLNEEWIHTIVKSLIKYNKQYHNIHIHSLLKLARGNILTQEIEELSAYILNDSSVITVSYYLKGATKLDRDKFIKYIVCNYNYHDIYYIIKDCYDNSNIVISIINYLAICNKPYTLYFLSTKLDNKCLPYIEEALIKVRAIKYSILYLFNIRDKGNEKKIKAHIDEMIQNKEYNLTDIKLIIKYYKEYLNLPLNDILDKLDFIGYILLNLTYVERLEYFVYLYKNNTPLNEVKLDIYKDLLSSKEKVKEEDAKLCDEVYANYLKKNKSGNIRKLEIKYE